MFRRFLAAAKGNKLGLLVISIRGDYGQDAVAPSGLYLYTQPITEKEVIRGESRKVPGRTAAAKRFFFVCIPLRAFSYGRAFVGVRSRTPVPLDAGLSTLPFARPPPFESGDAGSSTRPRNQRYAQFSSLSIARRLQRPACGEAP